MKSYLGERVLSDSEIQETEYEDYGSNEWIQYFISNYGYFDGSHHKQWVIDQVLRITHGATIKNIKLAEWDSGYTEYRFEFTEPSSSYWEFMGDDIDEDDFGIPP